MDEKTIIKDSKKYCLVEKNDVDWVDIIPEFVYRSFPESAVLKCYHNNQIIAVQTVHTIGKFPYGWRIENPDYRINEFFKWQMAKDVAAQTEGGLEIKAKIG